MRAEIEKKMKETADYIFRHPEISEQEVQSSRALAAFLEEEGFALSWGIAGFETAFSCPVGTGKTDSSDSLQSMMRFREWGRRCAAQEGLRAVRGMDAATTCWAQRVQALPVL